MISPITSLASAWGVLADLGRSALQWITGWHRILMFSARLLVLALSPSSYRGPNLAALVRHLVKDTAPVLLWFTPLPEPKYAGTTHFSRHRHEGISYPYPRRRGEGVK
jgi:hypothetical protein